MKAKIAEIFSSIQGEAKYLGSPTVFVRFAGCDIGCQWCDTDHEVKETLSCEEVVDRIEALYDPGYLISLTGGEPLLQWEFIQELLPLLKEKQMNVFLETNGVLYREYEKVKDGINIVSMDLKLPSSTGCRAFWAEHREMMEMAKEKDLFIKIVVTKNTSKEELIFAAQMIASVDASLVLYLQPNTDELKSGALDRCLEFQQTALEFLRDVRVVPQVHKLIDIP